MRKSTLFFLALLLIILGLGVIWIGIILNQMEGLGP